MNHSQYKDFVKSFVANEQVQLNTFHHHYAIQSCLEVFTNIANLELEQQYDEEDCINFKTVEEFCYGVIDQYDDFNKLDLDFEILKRLVTDQYHEEFAELQRIQQKIPKQMPLI